jgi:hypothetical protein
LSALASILLSGGAYQHYLIQIVPFAALFAAGVLVPGYRRRHTWLRRFPWQFVGTLVVLIATVPIAVKYVVIWRQYAREHTLRSGAEYAIADYLRPRLGSQDSLYMMDDHIVYWLLQRLPVDQSVTHPTNIAKPYLLKYMPGAAPTPEGAMAALLAKAPLYIVRPRQLPYLDDSPQALTLVDATLSAHYVLETTLSGRSIYRRQDGEPLQAAGLAAAEHVAPAGQ